MLMRPADAMPPDAWRPFLRAHDFGQFVLAGDGRAPPVIAPSHFLLLNDDRIWAHFTRDNPLWARLAESPHCTLALIDAYVYIPSAWNASPEEGEAYGVPTSYYAAVQVEGRARPVDAPHEMAELLNAMLAHFEPPGNARRRVEVGENPDARQFPAIRGLELVPDVVRAKAKFGGNRSAAHRTRVRERLLARGGPLDTEAAAWLARQNP